MLGIILTTGRDLSWRRTDRMQSNRDTSSGVRACNRALGLTGHWSLGTIHTSSMDKTDQSRMFVFSIEENLWFCVDSKFGATG